MPPEAPPGLRAAYDGLLRLIAGHPRDGAPAPTAEALVVGDARASAAERVHVYAHMYRSRIAEALESQFPRLARRLGAEAFAALTDAYLVDCPSRHPSLRFIGEKLPAWLAGRAGADAAHGDAAHGDAAGDGWLAELARLEWARTDVFDAEDEPVLSIDDLRAHPPELFAELPLRSIAAHRLIAGGRAAAAAWTAVGAATDGSASDVDGGGGARPPAPAGDTLLVWRQGTAVFHRAVDADEAGALADLARGTRFGAVCDRLAATLPADAAAARAFAWLSTWTADQLLVALSVAPASPAR
jgi:hypothetical protein